MNQDRGSIENSLAETLEVQAFPRRKKKRSKNWIIILIILLALGAAFVIYCTLQPEENLFVNVTSSPEANPSATESTIVRSIFSIAEDDEAFAESYINDPMQLNESLQNGDASLNPLLQEMDGLDQVWANCIENIMQQQDTEAAQSWLLMLDIAHADIWQHIDQLMALNENNDIWHDPNGIFNGSIEPVPDELDEYAFAMNTTEGGSSLKILGRLNTRIGSLYYIAKDPENKTRRFFECFRLRDGYMVQLLSSDGPYKGVLYFYFLNDSSVFCSYMSQDDYVKPVAYYKNPPTSWETFSENGKPQFQIEARAFEETDSYQGVQSDDLVLVP